MEGLRVLDLFAGSGALGLEALSRGAGEAQFVEQHSGACAVIQENLTRTRLTGGKLIKADVLPALRRLADNGIKFDIVFADPPYTKKFGDIDYGEKLLSSGDLRGVLSSDGIFVLETMVTKHESAAIADWTVVRDRTYGSTRILILQIPAPLDGETLSAPAS